jgi:15,16-dihydrobiliverdin:ferredoxin oxidoreductase
LRGQISRRNLRRAFRPVFPDVAVRCGHAVDEALARPRLPLRPPETLISPTLWRRERSGSRARAQRGAALRMSAPKSDPAMAGRAAAAAPCFLAPAPPLQRRARQLRAASLHRRRAVAARAAPRAALVDSSGRAAKLPWPESVGGDDVELLFMPFIEHQLKVMRAEFPDTTDAPFEERHSLQESSRRPARIESWQWKNTFFRKIRATYIDAGVAAQVFNSVWYPDPKYDLPLLGIDFLSFGKKKVLCVLDFQPLVQDEGYLKKYCEPIAYIKAKYDGLAGTMSARFYDETLFFSKQLAFAKFDNADPVNAQLLPAFKEYLRDYVAMVKGAAPNEDPAAVARVRALQREYDQYSAERDPAVGLFSTYWGEEWAEDFTYNYLFSDATPLTQEQKDANAAADAARKAAAKAAAAAAPQ